MAPEIVVVGAGPGGATAAMILAQQGHDVLLLDRHTFPRDKSCGDGIPESTIALLGRWGMASKFKEVNFYPIREMTISSPRNYVLKSHFPQNDGVVAPRYQFDALIQQHAVASGAKFRQAQVQGPMVVDGRVTGVRARINGHTEEITAKLVIAADGVTSTIARALRTEKHVDAHRAIALRAYLQNFDTIPHTIEFYLYQEILPGYAWIFPYGDNQVNIGLGMRLDKFRQGNYKLETMLDNFLTLPPIKKRLQPGWKLEQVATWQLNFGSQILPYSFDGALLVGDAAGLINPLTGGGIDNAVISGELAAQTAHEALQRGDLSQASLSIYDQRCHDAMWHHLHSSYKWQKWLYRFPILVDILAKWASSHSEFAKAFFTKL